MKKTYLIIVFFLTGLLINLIFPKNSIAVCRPRQNQTDQCNNMIWCVSGECCDTAVECKTPPNTSPRGPGANSPLGGKCGDTALDTAIGCIPLDETGLAGFILRWAIGIGGGIAFLFIVLAGFQILTSQGNPERLKAGQELLTSAIMGLILLIFSIFVLRVIGVDILAIPGFSK
jgi:hypothetical protein